MEIKVKNRSFAVASLVALLAAAPALADSNDNTSNIDQVGSDLTASATQEGENNTSVSNIDQGLGGPGSSGLDATVWQHGENSFHEAHIKQDGTDLIGNIDQHGAGGTDNYAYVEQHGADSEVQVLQNGTGNTNEVEVYQLSGSMNFVDVDQGGAGNSNTAGISQDGSNLSATLVQN